MGVEDPADWVLRANVCEFLAFSLRYPQAELAEALTSGEWFEAACEIAEVFGLAEDGLTRHDFCQEEGDSLLHALRVEATYLFVGERHPAVSPYEGVWRAQQDGVQALLFVNPHSMAVERFCKACGLGRPEGTNEPIDHVATELELLQYLAALAAGIVQPVEGGVVPDTLPGGSPAAAYEQFWADHAAKWMSDFADALLEKSRQPFYRSVAELLGAFVR